MQDYTHAFPAGKYYVGDPCYVIADKDWLGLLTDFDFFEKYDGLFEYNGKKCWTHSTAHGDGVYIDNKENEYGVDSGTIGILPVMACDAESLKDTGIRCGNIITFNEKFEVRYEDGVFHFGKMTIETD